jgi:glycogen(starch) synthase
MRILVINSEYPPIGGGAGTASARIAPRLTKLGHTVSVLTAHFGDLPRLERRENVTIHRIPALRLSPSRSSATEQLAFIISASFYSLSLARRFRPNVTLAFFGMPSGAVAWLLKRLYQIPYIVSLRGGDVPGFRPYDFKTYHRMIGPPLRVIWRDASAVVANSNGLRELARSFDPRIEIPVIPNGVDVTHFDAGQLVWDPPRLLSAGRVVYQKGLDLGLNALAGLRDLEWEWRIAGDGPQMASLQSLAGDLGIADRVIFLGWQTRDDLAQWYHRSNLFLFPSRHEGMPNVVLEAMASGLPVVATRIAGNEELVVEGQTGRLVPAEDAGALRESLRELLTSASLRERMGRAARLRVEREYTWESVTQQYSRMLEIAGKESG